MDSDFEKRWAVRSAHGQSIMKREVTRKKTLPAFRIDPAELNILWQRAVAVFDKPESVSGSLKVELPSEAVTFHSIDELRLCDTLPATVSKFSLHFYQEGRSVWIDSSTFFGSKPVVSARGDTEVWCAGAVETVYVFLLSHKASYAWFHATPLGWLLVVLTWGMWPLLSLVPKDVKIPWIALVGWLGLAATVTALYLTRQSLFPMAAISMKENESFVHKHVGELSLGVAILSLVFQLLDGSLRSDTSPSVSIAMNRQPPLSPTIADAGACIQVADSFYKLSRQYVDKLGPDLNTANQAADADYGGLISSATTLLFSIELYLKALVLKQGTGAPKTHELLTIFAALPLAIQISVEKVYNESTLDPAAAHAISLYVTPKGHAPDMSKFDPKALDRSFKKLLQRNANGFVAWRYLFSVGPSDAQNPPHYEFAHLALAALAVRSQAMK